MTQNATGFNAVVHALNLCEVQSSRTAKVEALKAAIATGQDAASCLKTLFVDAFNPFVKYRHYPKMMLTKKYEKVVKEEDLSLSDEQANKLFERLHQGLVYLTTTTATEDRRQFDAWLDTIPETYQKWFVRIVNRDLRCGVSVATVDSLFGKGTIPQCEIQLASEYGGDELTRTHWIEPKYDGLRGLAVISGGKVEFITRNGKQVWNTDLIEKALLSVGLQDVVVDGELFAGNWNDSLSITKTQSEHPKKAQLKFHIFDFLTLGEYQSQTCVRTLGVRRLQLQIFHSKITENVEQVVLSPRTMVHSKSEIIATAESFVEAGFEGGVLKDPESRYQYNRGESWRKVKFFKSYDLEIVDVEAGRGRLAETLGKIFVAGGDVKKTGCGTGYSDEMRNTLWTMHQAGQLVGKMVEVKAVPVLTKDGCLLFPVFLRLREDR
jgi:DNA ligase-1